LFEFKTGFEWTNKMKQATAPTAPHKDVWVETPQGRLFARIWSAREKKKMPGQDAPIILFHDSLGCVDLWRSFPARLCDRTGRRVIAYDRLGFGKSAPCPNELSVAFIRQEAETCFPSLRQQLNFSEFIAFGHSVGGAMAAHCAGNFPESCRSLITEAAQAVIEERTIQGLLDAKREFQKPGQLDRLKKYHGTKAEWVLNAWTETWLSPAFADWNLEKELPRVKCPVLVIHGSDDEFGSSRQPELIGRLVSGPAQISILSNCRHVPHREQEEIVLQLVTAFLNQQDQNL
jgi:pimeloyl-ACP methyl ester carboxylesterase